MARILVIDDDELSLEAVQIALEENGHALSTAKDGNAGMQLVNQQPFDLVITDLIMPEKEGMEVLLEIKQKHPSVKVIVISGGGRFSPDIYLDSAKVLGAEDVIAKPFSTSELIARIDLVLA